MADNSRTVTFCAQAIDGLYSALPQSGCVTRQMVRETARHRDMPVADAPQFNFCTDPAGLTNWLRVTVDPPLMFSTEDENSLFLAFDAQSCRVPWEYSSC